MLLVWCHFVGGTFEATFHELGSRTSLVPLRGIQQHCCNMLKAHKSFSRIVSCHFVEGTFEAMLHELGSRASLVPLRDIQQHSLKMLKTHKSCHFWGALGLYLGCSWTALGLPLGCPGPDFLMIP